MTYPTRDNATRGSAVNYFAHEPYPEPEKPRLDWLLLAVLTADLGVWVGLLAWWIWR